MSGKIRHISLLAQAAVILLAAVMMYGCRDTDPADISFGRAGDKVSVVFGTAVPGTTATRSLYDNEYTLAEADVLVFHEGYFYEHIQGDAPAVSGGGYTFNADLTYTDEPLTIVVVGNCRDALSGHPALVKGSPMETVLQNLTVPFAGYADQTIVNFPVAGKIQLNSLTGDTSIEGMKLLRAFAKLHVRLGNTARNDFEITSLRVFRAADSFRPVSDKTNAAGTKVTAPSVPDGAAFVVETYYVTSSDGISVTGVYLPESFEGDADQVPCAVIGGRYDNGAETFYRLDLTGGGVTGRVLRNHNYNITVTSVTGDGKATPQEAADNESSAINTDLIEWEDDGTNTFYDRDGNYITLSSRDIDLHFYTNSTKAVTVEKTIPGQYAVEFADANGKPQGGGLCGYGGEIRNDKFIVRVDSEGKTITATALTDNDGDGSVTQKLLVSLGNIQFTMTVVQASRSMRSHVHIFNLTDTAGDLGDEVMNEVSSDPIAGNKLRDLLKNGDNFGYEGVVPFAGYMISGRNFQTPIFKHLIEIFDVVFIGWQRQDQGAIVMVDGNEARNLVSWVSNPNKVLVAYCNNAALMDALDVEVHPVTNYHISEGYYLSADTPDFITDGPFGSVNPATFSTGTLHPYSMQFIETIDPLDNPDILPVLMCYNNNKIAVGVDTVRRVVYTNDYLLYGDDYWNMQMAGGGQVVTDMDIVMANLWAWVAQTVLGDQHGDVN